MTRILLAALMALLLTGCVATSPLPAGAINPSDPHHPALSQDAFELPVISDMSAGLEGESSHQKDPFSGANAAAMVHPPIRPSSDYAQHAAPADGVTIIYTCSMHPEVLSDKPGKCPKCGMTLIRKGTK